MLEATACRKMRITSESPGSISLSFLMVFRQQRNNQSEKLGGQGKKWEWGGNGEVPIRHLRKLRCSDIKELAKWHMVRKGFHSTCWPCGPGNNVGLHFRGEDSRNAVNPPRTWSGNGLSLFCGGAQPLTSPTEHPSTLRSTRDDVNASDKSPWNYPGGHTLTQLVQKVLLSNNRWQAARWAHSVHLQNWHWARSATSHPPPSNVCVENTQREVLKADHPAVTPTSTFITCQVSFPHQQGFAGPHSWSLSSFTFIKRMLTTLTEWAQLS